MSMSLPHTQQHKASQLRAVGEGLAFLGLFIYKHLKPKLSKINDIYRIVLMKLMQLTTHKKTINSNYDFMDKRSLIISCTDNSAQ